MNFDEFGPEKVIELYDPKTKLKAFLVIDNTILGPGKGGLRITPTISKEEVFRLARVMTFKTAFAGLPFGGAKAGIKANSYKLSKERKKELIQAFGKALKCISPCEYISAPDIAAGQQEMQWLVQANGSKKAATGKPRSLGGIPHELGSTGYGVFIALKTFLDFYGWKLNKMSFAIEGFGNVGLNVAKHIAKAKGKIIAVSDSKGLAVNNNGFDFKKLVKIKQKTGAVINYPNCLIKKTSEIVSLQADCLITAAIPDLINEKNYNKVKFKLIVEGSNIPIKHSVEKKLIKKGIQIIPDFVANAGGVISSYVEFKNGNAYEVKKLIEKKISTNTLLTLKKYCAKEENCCLRCSAQDLAIERLNNKLRK